MPTVYTEDFQTPLFVAEYMVSLIPNNCKTVLEPTPGKGNIIKFLTNYKVTAPEDFFLLKDARYDCVVMNPPFSSKYANIEHAPKGENFEGMRLGYYFLFKCMELSDNIIALMPWFTISDSDVRLTKLMNFGLKSITLLPRKTFQYARIQTCILVFEKKYSSQIGFHYLRHTNNQTKIFGEL